MGSLMLDCGVTRSHIMGMESVRPTTPHRTVYEFLTVEELRRQAEVDRETLRKRYGFTAKDEHEALKVAGINRQALRRIDRA